MVPRRKGKDSRWTLRRQSFVQTATWRFIASQCRTAFQDQKSERFAYRFQLLYLYQDEIPDLTKTRPSSLFGSHSVQRILFSNHYLHLGSRPISATPVMVALVLLRGAELPPLHPTAPCVPLPEPNRMLSGDLCFLKRRLVLLPFLVVLLHLRPRRVAETRLFLLDRYRLYVTGPPCCDVYDLHGIRSG